MAIRRDYENQGPSNDFLPALLTAEEFKGTPVEHAFTHIGNALSNGGMDPDTFANTIKEAKRMMGGGIPRDQLEDLKKMVGENVKKFVDGARNNALLNMPPHLIEAKEYLAGQVKDMDVRSQAFSNKNLGLSIDEISAEQQRNASGMMAMFIDQLTAELTNEDAGEVFDTVKQKLDEGSIGGMQEAQDVVNPLDASGVGRNRTFDGTNGPGTIGQPQKPGEFQIGGATGFEGRRDPLSGDVEMRKLEGPMSGIFSDASSGEHDLPELTKDLTPDELQEALRQARELIDMPPERQIAKFQDPNPLMWVGVAIAGILFPEMRPSLFALPFQVGLAERDRQQALFDRAYQDADQKWKTKLDVLTKRADVIQRERDRATSQEITVRGRDLQDARDWAKLYIDARQTTQKRMDGLWDKIDDYLEKGGTREAVRQTIKEINSMSDGKHLFINPEQEQAILRDSQKRYDLTTKGKELLNQGRELTNAGKLWTNNFNERTEELKVAGLEVGLDLKMIERDMNQFKLLNAPKDLALKWAQIIQNINQSQANIQNLISDNKRADANLELSKMRTQLTGLSELAGILKDRKSTKEGQLAGLDKQMGDAFLHGDTTAQARIQGEKATLQGDIKEIEDSLGKEGSDEGLYGYIKQVGGQVSDIQDKFGGIDRPNTPSIPGGDVKVPKGYGESRSITAPKDDGKYALDNGGTFDLGQTYKYGAKGADGKTDCCLHGDTPIWTEYGIVPIKDVKVGSRVWSYESGKAVLRRVADVIQQPPRRLYEVRTRQHRVIASSNHPFLIPVKEGRNWGRLAWVDIDGGLARGSLATHLTKLPDSGSERKSDATFAWLAGLYIADGSHPGGGNLSWCVYGTLADRVGNVVKDIFGTGHKKSNEHGVTIYNTDAAKLYRKLGLTGTSLTKRIPRWVWESNEVDRLAFLHGYLDGDGYKHIRVKKGTTYECWHVATANRLLAEDIKMLARSLGFNASNTSVTERTKPIVIKGKTVKDAKPMHRFDIYPNSNRGAAKYYHQHPRIRQFYSEPFEPKMVVSVTPRERDEVSYDLVVEDSHTFIADGLVVHNSGFVCTTMSSIGSPELKNFPAGSIAQTSFIEGKIQNGDVHWGRAQEQWEKDYKSWGEGVEKYNAWVAKYNAAPAGRKPFLMNEMPKEPGDPPSLNKTLKNGDLVYFIVPKTKPEDSGRHVGIYIGTDKDGKALIAEAYSARVPDAEQVRIASYDLDALLPRSDEEIKAASKKMFMGAYRFYPKGKQ